MNNNLTLLALMIVFAASGCQLTNPPHKYTWHGPNGSKIDYFPAYVERTPQVDSISHDPQDPVQHRQAPLKMLPPAKIAREAFGSQGISPNQRQEPILGSSAPLYPQRHPYKIEDSEVPKQQDVWISPNKNELPSRSVPKYLPELLPAPVPNKKLTHPKIGEKGFDLAT